MIGVGQASRPSKHHGGYSTLVYSSCMEAVQLGLASKQVDIDKSTQLLHRESPHEDEDVSSMAACTYTCRPADLQTDRLHCE